MMVEENIKSSNYEVISDDYVGIDRITLMTFNVGLMCIHVCGVNCLSNPPFIQERLLYIPDALRSSNTDIVALQEIYSEPDTQFVTQSLSTLYPFVARQSNGSGPHRKHNGLLILSRFPIIRQKFHSFNEVTNIERFFASKGCLEAVVVIPSVGLVNLLNIHTASATLSPEATDVEEIRNSEIRQVLELAEAAASRGELPIILGDLNAGPESSVSNYNLLTEKGWRDSFTDSASFQADSSSFLEMKLGRDSATLIEQLAKRLTTEEASRIIRMRGAPGGRLSVSAKALEDELFNMYEGKGWKRDETQNYRKKFHKNKDTLTVNHICKDCGGVKPLLQSDSCLTNLNDRNDLAGNILQSMSLFLGIEQDQSEEKQNHLQSDSKSETEDFPVIQSNFDSEEKQFAKANVRGCCVCQGEAVFYSDEFSPSVALNSYSAISDVLSGRPQASSKSITSKMSGGWAMHGMNDSVSKLSSINTEQVNDVNDGIISTKKLLYRDAPFDEAISIVSSLIPPLLNVGQTTPPSSIASDESCSFCMDESSWADSNVSFSSKTEKDGSDWLSSINSSESSCLSDFNSDGDETVVLSSSSSLNSFESVSTHSQLKDNTQNKKTRIKKKNKQKNDNSSNKNNAQLLVASNPHNIIRNHSKKLELPLDSETKSFFDMHRKHHRIHPQNNCNSMSPQTNYNHSKSPSNSSFSFKNQILQNDLKLSYKNFTKKNQTSELLPISEADAESSILLSSTDINSHNPAFPSPFIQPIRCPPLVAHDEVSSISLALPTLVGSPIRKNEGDAEEDYYACPRCGRKKIFFHSSKHLPAVSLSRKRSRTSKNRQELLKEKNNTEKDVSFFTLPPTPPFLSSKLDKVRKKIKLISKKLGGFVSKTTARARALAMMEGDESSVNATLIETGEVYTYTNVEDEEDNGTDVIGKRQKKKMIESDKSSINKIKSFSSKISNMLHNNTSSRKKRKKKKHSLTYNQMVNSYCEALIEAHIILGFSWDPLNPLNALGPHWKSPGQRCDHIFLPSSHLAAEADIDKNVRRNVDWVTTRAEVLFTEPVVRLGTEATSLGSGSCCRAIWRLLDIRQWVYLPWLLVKSLFKGRREFKEENVTGESEVIHLHPHQHHFHEIAEDKSIYAKTHVIPQVHMENSHSILLDISRKEMEEGHKEYIVDGQNHTEKKIEIILPVDSLHEDKNESIPSNCNSPGVNFPIPPTDVDSCTETPFIHLSNEHIKQSSHLLQPYPLTDDHHLIPSASFPAAQPLPLCLNGHFRRPTSVLEIMNSSNRHTLMQQVTLTEDGQVHAPGGLTEKDAKDAVAVQQQKAPRAVTISDHYAVKVTLARRSALAAEMSLLSKGQK